jgi:hypothetical protein
MKKWISLGLGLSAMVVSSFASAQADITNGTITIGVNRTGSLVTSTTTNTGIKVNRNGNDGLSAGCACEGWGVGAVGVTSGYSGQDMGTSNVSVSSFTSTGSTAQSVTTIGSGIKVTHDFTPSAATPFLYQVRVTIQNTTANDFAAGDLRYRRTMDWDIPPNVFNEFVTIQGVPTLLGIANGSNVLSTGDDGFATANALAASAGTLSCPLNTNFVDCGPEDHGADFIFQFGALKAGESTAFNIYYGAAPSEAQALAALSAVGSGLYSLGQADTGATTGEPDTYIFGFGVVGGVIVDPPQLPAPAIIGMLLLGLGLIGRQRRRA